MHHFHDVATAGKDASLYCLGCTVMARDLDYGRTLQPLPFSRA